MNKKNVILEKSYKLALMVIELIKKLPRTPEGYIISNQLGKAGTSVGANVEEAIGAFSKEDCIRSIRQSNFEVFEISPSKPLISRFVVKKPRRSDFTIEY